MVRTLRLKKSGTPDQGGEMPPDPATTPESPPDTPPKPHDKPPRQDHPLLRKFEIRRGEDA